MLDGELIVLTGRSTRARRDGVLCAMSKNLVPQLVSHCLEVGSRLRSLGAEAYYDQTERARGRADEIGSQMYQLSTAH